MGMGRVSLMDVVVFDLVIYRWRGEVGEVEVPGQRVIRLV